jgi:hypothetical protein
VAPLDVPALALRGLAGRSAHSRRTHSHSFGGMVFRVRWHFALRSRRPSYLLVPGLRAPLPASRCRRNPRAHSGTTPALLLLLGLLLFLFLFSSSSAGFVSLLGKGGEGRLVAWCRLSSVPLARLLHSQPCSLHCAMAMPSERRQGDHRAIFFEGASQHLTSPRHYQTDTHPVQHPASHLPPRACSNPRA